ncbi:uncharacterized protein ACBR49_008393 isoform 2-T2 [Aulostomus maculatus]
MDQDETMDFKALRAKFQDEELHLKQPKIKPALPEKPKVVPTPQSPPHYLPAGARPSLLTSISQSLEGKTVIAPRVVFKDDKKENKKAFSLANPKGKEKSEETLLKGKEKVTKRSKEKSDDPVYQKLKNPKDKKAPLFPPMAAKEREAELVPATPPPKAPAAKKKGFLGFMRSSKNSVEVPEVPADAILDMASPGDPGPAPLVPLTAGFSPAEPEISAPEDLLPEVSSIPDAGDVMETPPPFTIPPPPDFIPPPAFFPDIPAPELPAPESETPLEVETPPLPVSRPASQNEIMTIPPSTVPTPPPGHQATSGPPSVVSTLTPSPPPSEVVALADSIVSVEQPPPLVLDPPSASSSPQPECPISALSALERAEDMSPGKKVAPADQRILNALEKARRKTNTSSLTNLNYSITPPPEEFPPPQSPTLSLPELPPVDYEGQVNGFDHRKASQLMDGDADEGASLLPEMLVVPPPPPKKIIPEPPSLDSSPEKSSNPQYDHLFIPPPPLHDDAAELLGAAEFSEADTTDVPEFDDVTSDAHSPQLQASEWGNGDYSGPATPDGKNLPDFHSNGVTVPGAEAQGEVVLGGDGQHGTPAATLPDPSLLGLQDAQAMASSQTYNGINGDAANVYEDFVTSVTKKKGKNDGGKKRKGPPKNPYDETPQETCLQNEEKSKTGKSSKSDKRASAEGLDEKELKKKEKQRLEKEKKELKERQEREKKEQKEREKKENEMKKKFKITGQEDAIYQAKVTVTTKGRKTDLPVTSGDIVSIIRTTNCPKGKWLARDSSNNYGYVAVEHVELDIKEMLEMGKKAVSTHQSSSNVMDMDTSTGSRMSNHFPGSQESFTDDSEEWTNDDDEHLHSPTDTADAFVQMSHTRTVSVPDMGNKELSINHQHNHSDLSPDGSHVQARHEALQKLATFFHLPKPVEPSTSTAEPETSPDLVKEEVAHAPEESSEQDMDFDPTTLILPPPDLYADVTVE